MMDKLEKLTRLPMIRYLAIVCVATVALPNSLAVAEPARCAVLDIDAAESLPLGIVIRPPLRQCRLRDNGGYPLPDPLCTPGAINPTVTLDVLTDPNFVTACVRHRGSTPTTKNVVYSWYGIARPPGNTGHNTQCQLDHLVPLQLGGADTLDNIWPQCGSLAVEYKCRDFNLKDAVGRYLTKMVKQGQMPLADAQHAIATNWTSYLDEAIGRTWRQTCPNLQ